MSYDKIRMVTFKLNNHINVEELSEKSEFTFERNYRTGENEVTEVIECKLLGVRRTPQVPPKPLYDRNVNDVKWIELYSVAYSQK